MATSIAEDYEWQMTAYSVVQLCKRLEDVRVKMVEWGDRNHLTFDNTMDVMIAFRSPRKPELKK